MLNPIHIRVLNLRQQFLEKMIKEETSTINNDGLRYKSKVNGSPFRPSTSLGTMSCYKCGLHKARGLGTFKRLLSQNMFLCGDCKPKKQI